MVHNLRMVSWQHLNSVGYAYDWAREVDETIKEHLRSCNHNPLIEYHNQGKAFQLAIPTPEHYLPMLYTLALQEKDEDLSIFNDKALGGSLTMTSFKIG